MLYDIVEIQLQDFLIRQQQIEGPRGELYWSLKYDIEFKFDFNGLDVEVKVKKWFPNFPVRGGKVLYVTGS